jgi:uncharacterized membrane protein YsdA (DUF1294 family)
VCGDTLDDVKLAQILGLTPTMWLVGAYAVMSVLTLAAYAADKSAARRGRRRVRERTLHTLELLGGWPGALVAQQLFRHKRRKWRFFLVTWLIATAHVAGIVMLLK